MNPQNSSSATTMNKSSHLELLDYRRRVSDIHAQLRASDEPAQARWEQYRRARQELFATHPQSALTEDQKANFRGLGYYPYDPAWRFVLPVDLDVEPQVFDVPLQDDGLFQMQRFGKLHFQIAGQPLSLSLFWVLGYGGGVFLPFRDATNGEATYGGGRYLLDTIKHADLGQQDGQLVIDFNFAYNPSCAYNERWHCPLAPTENWLSLPVDAGERAYPGNG